VSIDPLGSGLGAIALVQGRVEAFLNSNEVKNAFQELKAELRRSHEIPPGEHDSVWREVEGVRIDPDFLSALFAYLHSGEQQALERMGARLMQLLRLDEQAVSRKTVTDLTVRIVERNRHLMKKSALEALHLDHLILESRVEEVRAGVEAVRAEQRELGERLSGQLQETRTSAVAGVRLVDRETDFAQLLEKLAEHSPEEAGLLRTAIDAGGSNRVANLIRAPQPWLESGSAQLWVAAARAAQRGNHYEEAEAAFVRAADHPGVDDRVRQLIRASSMARVRGEDARGQELFGQAQALSATHPAVLVVEARQSEDADAMIDLLEGVEGLDDAQTAEIHATLCGAYLTKGDLEKAREALAITREADPSSVGAREMSAMFALETARRSLSEDREPNRRSLVEAGEQFAELVREVLDEARRDEAGAVAVRAIEAFVLADESDRADALFALLLAEPRTYRDSETAKRLGETALHAQRADLVDRFLPDDRDEITRLLRAEATALRSEGDRHADVEPLRELMRNAAEEPVRLRAALAILGSSTVSSAVQWDPDAEAVLEQHHPWVVARLKAERLETEGDRDAAERVLRPYQAQPSVMRYLIGLAGRAEDFDKALRLSERLLDAGPDERDRIRHCELLRAVGDRARARAEFLALARDPSISDRERSAAYRQASKLLEEDGDLNALERTAKEWFENLANDEDAGWLRLYALMRLTRFDDAFRAWQEILLEPSSEQQAALLGQLVALRDEPVPALTRIAALADQHPESERL
jgi:tetratricopeptide (TPR) repeat protein